MASTLGTYPASADAAALPGRRSVKGSWTEKVGPGRRPRERSDERRPSAPAVGWREVTRRSPAESILPQASRRKDRAPLSWGDRSDRTFRHEGLRFAHVR